MNFVITLVASAIASGSSEYVVAQQVTDSYNDLKRLIIDRYPDVDVSALERKPHSEAKKASLAEDLDDAGAADDRALEAAALRVLRALHRVDAAPLELPGAAPAGAEKPTGSDAAALFGGAVAAEDAGRTQEAEALYRRAADLGHVTAMNNLALLLEAERPECAEEWFRKAADAGHTGAMTTLGVLLEKRGRVEEGEAWYRRAADTGEPNAMFNLGLLLEDAGKSEPAELWTRRAADAGHATAMFNLGVLADDSGRTEEAEAWWRRAAAAGHPKTMFNLAITSEEAGRSADAETWYRRAGEAGHPAAMFNLACTCGRRVGNRRPRPGIERPLMLGTWPRCSTWACYSKLSAKWGRPSRGTAKPPRRVKPLR
ncbi:tetratricopeptide repeat protein [Nocardia sp. NRRL WC-3656]|uniref:tetratricopeptide repeat protein n=1 Tax=Nocardia sp. NRRL WC-3656 TaxID=1463824 RepID=UPI00068DF2CE|nr:tetratricopeptide repeat protein [Nocardia sp. NRRL WC-3656]